MKYIYTFQQKARDHANYYDIPCFLSAFIERKRKEKNREKKNNFLSLIGKHADPR